MKICHVNFARGFGGGERQTQLLISTLAEKGVEQAIVARADSPLHDMLSGTAGLTCYPLQNTFVAGLLRLGKFQPDIVHAHCARSAQWTLLNYYLRKTPYIITRRVPNPIGRSAFTRAVYRNAIRVVALSTAIRTRIQELQADKTVQIIPSMYASLPIDAAKVAQLRQHYQDQFIVGHIGALVDHNKGQSVLIGAAQQLRSKYPNMRFVLLGRGPDEEMLKRLAAAAGNVDFIGFVKDVGNWISLFDIFTFPSLYEGLGSTLLDVMQQGKPIVASGVSGILDVITDGHNGLLVEPSDAKQLADAIERLYLDAGLRQQLGQGGRQELRRYSPQRIVECYYREYQAIIAGGNSTAR